MYNFGNFADELEQIIDAGGDLKTIINQGSDSMRKLLCNNSLINDDHIRGIYDGTVDSTVYKSEKNGFIVQVFTWDEGSETPIHDHDTWGLMGIYRNCLKVAEFSLDNNDLKDTQTYIAEEGDVCYLIPPDEEIHQICNPTDKMSISIHVYGKTINEYNIYDMENGQVIHRVV